MKKSLRAMVVVMIVVVAAGGIFLWQQQKRAEKILAGTDPESYDVEATCIRVEKNHLICNAGNDDYLYLDGVKVILRNRDVTIQESGDETTEITYRNFSLKDLEQEVQKKKEVPVYLWLTGNGKVRMIMAGRESFENRNASLSNLDGLNPNTATVTKVILSMNRRGMRMAPAGYTPETADKFENLIGNYQFAKQVKFYRGIVTINVDQDGGRHRNIRYGRDSYDTVKRRLGEGLTAHIWFDEKGRITAVLVHEEKVILQ